MNTPTYANGFSISYNAQIHEVVVSFIQEYPTITFDPESGAIQNGVPSSKVITNSVAIPESIAIQLRSILNDILPSSKE